MSWMLTSQAKFANEDRNDNIVIFGRTFPKFMPLFFFYFLFDIIVGSFEVGSNSTEDVIYPSPASTNGNILYDLSIVLQPRN